MIEEKTNTDSQSQPCGEVASQYSVPEAGGSATVSYSFEYRNYASPEWQPSVFDGRFNPLPTTRSEAASILVELVKRWVPGTQFRVVETTRSVAVSPPVGEFSPVRVFPALSLTTEG